MGTNNWVPWKRRISAILRDLGLEEYIEKDSKYPVARDPAKLNEEEEKLQKQWCIRDAEMIHISGAVMAQELQYFSMPLTFLQEWPNSAGIHRNPLEWDWNPLEWLHSCRNDIY